MHILFLSANDFKEKSIQVIRKTPEAYIAAGHKVTYLVLRDRSTAGNYFYEKEINPDGVDVKRYSMPLTSLRNFTKGTPFLVILTQLATYLGVIRLFIKASKILRHENIDIVYGYEVLGVNTMKLLSFFGKLKKQKQVSRFQGTWIAKYLKENDRLKLLLNWDDIVALKSKSDLCIMTDDGTEGDYAMERLKSKSFSKLNFWVNGVDNIKLEKDAYSDLKEKYNPDGNKTILLSVSRLEPWKRVDRILHSLHHLIHKHQVTDILYLMVGEGAEMNSYKKLVEELDLQHYVVFVGGINNLEVKKYLNFADIFCSTYDLSNVGNPLLEAIRTHNIIFTLNNGTTNQWIQHLQNGFIYDVTSDLAEKIGDDLFKVIKDKELQEEIKKGIIQTEQLKLWTWNQRLKAEVSKVENLLN